MAPRGDRAQSRNRLRPMDDFVQHQQRHPPETGMVHGTKSNERNAHASSKEQARLLFPLANGHRPNAGPFARAYDRDNSFVVVDAQLFPQPRDLCPGAFLCVRTQQKGDAGHPFAQALRSKLGLRIRILAVISGTVGVDALSVYAARAAPRLPSEALTSRPDVQFRRPYCSSRPSAAVGQPWKPPVRPMETDVGGT